MSGRFERSLAFILRSDIEGGYVNDKDDHGGATNHGITQHTLDIWQDSHGLPRLDVKYVPDAIVAAIYKADYWFAIHADDFDEPVDMVMFDGCVQHGGSRAVKLLQKALHTTADGIIGPGTRAAYSRAIAIEGPEAVARAVLKVRREFYAAIVANNPTQAKFSKGWANRVMKLEKECGL